MSVLINFLLQNTNLVSVLWLCKICPSFAGHILNGWRSFFFTGEQPLQVARCTKIINADSDDPKYIINVKQFAKFVVDLGDQVAPTDIEEGMRVG
jgi:hypothetical protein